MAGDYDIRVGEREDLPALEASWRSLYAHHSEVSTGPLPFLTADERWPKRLAEFEDSFDAGVGMVLIAESGGEIVGFAFAKLVSPDHVVDTGPMAELEVLVVLPERRGQGIGEALTRRTYALLRERGARTVLIEVIEGNESALRFYERFGATPARHVLFGRVDSAPEAP